MEIGTQTQPICTRFYPSRDVDVQTDCSYRRNAREIHKWEKEFRRQNQHPVARRGEQDETPQSTSRHRPRGETELFTAVGLSDYPRCEGGVIQWRTSPSQIMQDPILLQQARTVMVTAEMKGVSRVGAAKGFAHIAVWSEEENQHAANNYKMQTGNYLSMMHSPNGMPFHLQSDADKAIDVSILRRAIKIVLSDRDKDAGRHKSRPDWEDGSHERWQSEGFWRGGYPANWVWFTLQSLDTYELRMLNALDNLMLIHFWEWGDIPTFADDHYKRYGVQESYASQTKGGLEVVTRASQIARVQVPPSSEDHEEPPELDGAFEPPCCRVHALSVSMARRHVLTAAIATVLDELHRSTPLRPYLTIKSFTYGPPGASWVRFGPPGASWAPFEICLLGSVLCLF